MKKILFFLFIFIAVFSVIYTVVQKNTAKQKNDMLYGGKPKAPILVSTDISGEINADTEYNMNIILTPIKSCSQLKTRINGLDGVIVHNGETKNFDSCNIGQQYVHTIQISVPANTAGYVSVNIEMTVNGHFISTVKAFSIKSKNSTYSNKPNGTLKTDSKGNKLIIQKAEEK